MIHHRLQGFVRLAASVDGLTRFAFIWIALLVLVGFLGPRLPLGSPSAIAAGPRLAPPAADWLTGTDHLGRSTLPRIVQGIGTTFLLSTGSVLITAMLGTLIGTISAYMKGPLDEFIVRASDILFSFPTILLAILLSAFIGPGELAIVVAIVLITLPLLIRVVRAATLVVVERDFVTSSLVAGAGIVRVVVVHIFPNVVGPVVVQTTFSISVAMVVESTLSFLGLGVRPPDASLGSLVYDGILYLETSPWLVFIPGAVLASAILAVNLLGDGVRDLLDPREVQALL